MDRTPGGVLMVLGLVLGLMAGGCASDDPSPSDPGAALVVTLSVDTLRAFLGEHVPLMATVTDAVTGALATGPVTWVSSDPTVAAVDAEGVVTGTGVGATEVRAEVSGTSATVTVLVVEPLSLRVPVDGTVGVDYFMNHYMAHPDPLGEPLDFHCGLKAPPEHQGTDFALADFEAMRQEVPVRAAAAGTVVEVHDGESNFSIHIGPDSPPNRVVVDHGDARRTVYENLWEGTLQVQAGDEVDAGAPLGLVGSSGGSWIPHLHFEVRLGDRAVDPFAGTCGGPVDQWAQPMPYRDGFMLLRARVSDYQLQTAPHLAVDAPAAADTIVAGRDFVAWIQELNAEVLSRSRIRILDGRGQVRYEVDQYRTSGPQGLSWLGRRISTEGVTASGTWTMEYLYKDTVRRRVPFEMVVP